MYRFIKLDYKILGTVFLFLVIFMSSCATEEHEVQEQPIRLTYSFSNKQTTRAGTNIQNTQFDESAQVNVYVTNASTGSAIGNSPTVCTADGSGNLTFASPLYYPVGDDSRINIRSYFPTTKTSISMSTFTVEDNQISDANYNLSDLMFAQVSNQAKTSGEVNLQFNHKLSKIIIEAIGEADIKITAINLLRAYRTIGFSPSSGVVGSESTLADRAGQISVATSESGASSLSGAAVIPPQKLSGNFLEISTNEGVATFSLATEKELISGNEYKLQVKISSANIGKTATLFEWKDGDDTYYQTAIDGDVLRIIGDIADHIYNNKEKKPAPPVYYGSTKLTLNIDYTLSYMNNINVGTAAVIAEGKSGTVYEGLKAVKSFDIIVGSGSTFDFDYTGQIVAWICPYSGKYKLEVWGAQGGDGRNASYGNDGNNGIGGNGGYSYGTISLQKNQVLYVCVGGQGQTPPENSNSSIAGSGGAAGFNGGGVGAGASKAGSGGISRSGGGGGATDISLNGTDGSDDWNTTAHLYSRIIVAGGGGSATWSYSPYTHGGYGGGENGGDGVTYGSSTAAGKGGTPTAGGAGGDNAGVFGKGGDAVQPTVNNTAGAGGGGWYGGGSGTKNSAGSTHCTGGGGSGYVYTSSTAANYPSGCLLDSSHYLEDAATVAGNTTFKSPSGTDETGHTGNGYARITFIE